MQASASTPAAVADQAKAERGAIRPFHVDIPQEDLDDLRRRIAATRWPQGELVDDPSQGAQLATMQELTRYWATDHDWRQCEAKLNALPQFKTEIDGLDVHFIHVKSAHDNALPLIITHGWPGSVIELLEVIEPLTNPTAHGGGAGGQTPAEVSLPVAFTVFPGEIFHAPRSWAEKVYPNLNYFNEVDRGGHFAAWEEPELFSAELRAAFSALR